MTQKTARKNIFVNRDIQGQIVGRLAKYWILYHLGFWSILFAVEFFRQIIEGFLVGPKASLGDFFAKFSKNLFNSLFATATAALIALALFGRRFREVSRAALPGRSAAAGAAA